MILFGICKKYAKKEMQMWCFASLFVVFCKRSSLSLE